MFPIIPYIISLIGAIVVYMFLDKNNKISSMVMSIIKIKSEWRNFTILVIILALLIAINIGLEYFIINGLVLSIVNGIITGIGVSIVRV